MNETFDLLLSRIIDSNRNIDYETMIYKLEKIKSACICIGTGGSNIVSEYAKEVLNYDNGVLAMNLEPRTFLYTNSMGCHNACIFSYGGHNYGIDEVIKKTNKERINSLVFTADDRHLLELNPSHIINYQGVLDKEISFISIASTFIPMSLMLRYHLRYQNIDFEKLVKDIYLDSTNFTANMDIDLVNNDIDVMTGDNTFTASFAFESTAVEAGLVRPLLHEKYSYCHGRTTLPYYYKPSVLLYFINGQEKEIDKVLLNNITPLYNQVILVKSEYGDPIIGSFDLTMKSMFIAKRIAGIKSQDLSHVDYAPQVKKLYRFKGVM